MKYFIGLLLILLTTLYGPLSAQATEIIEPLQSVRGAGMGGIYMSIVRGADAVFYNPAALSKVKGLDIQLLDLNFGANGKDRYDQLRGIDASDPNSYSALYGKDIWIRAAGDTAIAIPNFGLGVYTNYNVQMSLHNPAFPQFYTNFLNDTGFALGNSFSLGGNAVGGIALKRVNRWAGQKDIDLGVIASGEASHIADQFKNKGYGYGVDLALMNTVKGVFETTYSAVWKDVGCTAFQLTEGDTVPERMHDNLSLGVSSFLDLPGLDLTFGLEYRHLTESQYQQGQKIHMGTEVSLPFIDLRAGLNQGYATYGAGFDLFFLRFDVASYTEEVGAYAGQTPESRLQLGLSLDLSFDADFKIMDSDGKKRKLKQRR